jgi:hypothetical protein
MTQDQLDSLGISLTLSVAEINTVLSVLGKQPFDQVADLILKVRSVTLQQIADAQQAPVAGAAEGKA